MLRVDGKFYTQCSIIGTIAAMLDLNDLYYFCMVVRHQGFAAAGRASGIPKSKLSRRIAQLESQLGTRLIERSTRHFRITNIGQSFFQEAQAALTGHAILLTDRVRHLI